jgi:hypothetical protein
MPDNDDASGLPAALRPLRRGEQVLDTPIRIEFVHDLEAAGQRRCGLLRTQGAAGQQYRAFRGARPQPFGHRGSLLEPAAGQVALEVEAYVALLGLGMAPKNQVHRTWFLFVLL